MLLSTRAGKPGGHHKQEQVDQLRPGCYMVGVSRDMSETPTCGCLACHVTRPYYGSGSLFFLEEQRRPIAHQALVHQPGLGF